MRWGMYGVRVCVAAKVRMIPIPILYCHSTCCHNNLYTGIRLQI